MTFERGLVVWWVVWVVFFWFAFFFFFHFSPETVERKIEKNGVKTKGSLQPEGQLSDSVRPKHAPLASAISVLETPHVGWAGGSRSSCPHHLPWEVECIEIITIK